jgi:hypothetical protein
VSEATRWAVRVVGRGVVTTVNDEPMLTREHAEEVARTIRETMGERATVERLILSVSVPG